jgi:hypothetical protein
MAQTMIELDSRRRTSLGRLGHKDHNRYLVNEQEDGTLILTPAVVMSEREAAILANPERMADIMVGIAHAKGGRTKPLDFSQFDD